MTSLFQNACQAKNYALFRPAYSKRLYGRIVKEIKCNKNDDAVVATFADDDHIISFDDAAEGATIALDVGCGTGQATHALTEYFDHVIGIDPSHEQIKNAVQHPNITYKIGTSNYLPCPDKSITCITVAQAAHWFDNIQTEFYAEVYRVLKPGGVLAIWTYGIPYFPNNNFIQSLIVNDLYETQLGKYWDPRRKIVENRYIDIPLPNTIQFNSKRLMDDYDDEKTEKLDLCSSWTVEQLFGYIRSWSAYTKYCQEHNVIPKSKNDPLTSIADTMKTINLTKEMIDIRWPVTLLLCTKRI